jgi:ABC-type sugar transport system ATPase subunit
MMGKQPILSLEKITKAFASNTVLNEVSMNVYPGSIHAVIGENGAGKSTLMKIIGGIYTKDSGEICIDGKSVTYTSPSQAIAAGISIVHQELSIAENLSVAHNVFCNREPINAFGFIREKELNRKVAAIFLKLGVDIDPKDRTANLSVAQQQLVEIAKAVSQNSRLIIMDEPTSSLSDKEVDYLYSIVAGLKAEGISIIFISHKLNEVFRVSDRISVLRDGNMIGTKETSETDVNEIISMMVGRHIDDLFPPKSTKITDEVIMEVSGYTKHGMFEDVNFSLKKGEILGFSGLVGAGRTEVARAIFGADPIDAGELQLHGQKVKIKSSKKAIAKGLCYLTEDRKLLGLFQTTPVKWNIVSASLRNFVSIFGFYQKAKINAQSIEYLKKLDIRPFNDETQVINLSGGNQQKVLLAKWLSTDPKVLIVDEPTRGVDVGAKSQIHNLLRELSEAGIGVIVISSEQPEILGLCDRVLVFCEGKITKDFGNTAVTQEDIMKYASGVSLAENRGEKE